jgi:hypothetical protein
MNMTMPQFTHRYKFWFYFRKGLFQVFFPIFLTFLTFTDYVEQSGKTNNGYAYNHLYFYTSVLLFFYTGLRYIFDFIFSICADDIILKKEIDLGRSTPQLLISTDSKNLEPENHFIIIVKKIFKLRYSKSPFFIYITKICWFLGIDSPIFIPENIVKKMGNIKNDLTPENEESSLHTTLMNLYSYHPRLYEVTPVIDTSDSGQLDSLEEGLVPKHVITKIDKTICDIQKELFNKQTEINTPNVV